MNEQTKQKAGIVYNVVESVVLAMSVGLMVWLANVVIEHGNALTGQSVSIGINSRRLESIETLGSRSLGEHEKEDDARIIELKRRMDAVEAAVISLQSAPGELKAIGARLDALSKGQDRMESALKEHMNREAK